METTLKTQQTKTGTISNDQSSTFWQKAEANRFGIIPMLIIVVACLGGMAAAFGAKDDVIKLALIVFPTIIMLAFTLAVAPMRLILWTAVIAVVLQTAVLIF